MLGIVADDLTGSATVGAFIAASGCRARVVLEHEFTGLEAFAHQEALIVTSNSRSMKPAEDAEKIKEAMQFLNLCGCSHFAKRIDSTLRGLIGFEIEKMLEAMSGDAIAIMVPAIPDANKICVGGFSLINLIPLSKTGASADILTPITDSYVPNIIASQTELPVALITIGDVIKGKETLLRKIKEAKSAGIKILIIDAITNEDISVIAEAIHLMKSEFLVVDPGPLSAALVSSRPVSEKISGRYINNKLITNRNASETQKYVIAITGSASEITREQTQLLASKPDTLTLNIKTDGLLKDGQGFESMKDDLAKLIKSKLRSNGKFKNIIIALDTVLTTQIKPGECIKNPNSDLSIVAKIISRQLGKLAAELIRTVGVSRIQGLYVSGGDVASSTCRALGIPAIQMCGSLAPQVDVGMISGSDLNGIPIVLKGGLTGDSNTAINVTNALIDLENKL